MNGYFIAEPNALLRQRIDAYYQAAEQAGWPDRLDRGRFKFGWGAERRRGIVTCRYVHLVLPGHDRKRELERFELGLELQWHYYGPFGFGALVAAIHGKDPRDFDLTQPIQGQDLIDAEIALFGTSDEVGEKILRVKESCGYEDFMFHAGFEKGGFSGREIEEQMQFFAQAVAPGLRRACGGSPRRGATDVPAFDDVRAGSAAEPQTGSGAPARRARS